MLTHTYYYTAAFMSAGMNARTHTYAQKCTAYATFGFARQFPPLCSSKQAVKPRVVYLYKKCNLQTSKSAVLVSLSPSLGASLNPPLYQPYWYTYTAKIMVNVKVNACSLVQQETAISRFRWVSMPVSTYLRKAHVSLRKLVECAPSACF